MSTGVLIFICIVGWFLYFIPSIVANDRRHNNKLSIFVLNLFLGWSFIGWVVALVWACSNNANKNDKLGKLGYFIFFIPFLLGICFYKGLAN
ncbi:MAG: hypothetical protein QG673_522 [Pseudomonadota bacterium]|nr:hypothetical protein [Pseudomonadota bacterium]